MDFHYGNDGQMIHNEGCDGIIMFMKDDEGGGYICDCLKQWDTEETKPMMDESIAEETVRKIDLNPPPAVYRQCTDTRCPAWDDDVPHSHFENAPISEGELARFKAKWDSLTDFSGTVTVVHTDGTTEEVRPMLETSPVQQWVSVPIDQPDWLMQKIGEYITWVETAVTDEVCKCVRVPHPDPTMASIWGGDTDLTCPQHAKEGLVLGFFTWLERHGG